MQTSKHDAKYSSIVGSGVGGMPRTRYTTRGREAAEYFEGLRGLILMNS